jgi:CHAT domain-containing protein
MDVRTHEWQEVDEGTIHRSAPGAQVLHLATHAYRLASDCLPAVPADPAAMTGLQLAGINRPRPDESRLEDDGLLSALELGHVDLQQAELVVFSGGGTARGPDVSDSERFGLMSAAWIAGAGASLGTLWDVDDETMPLDVAVFYRSWLQDRSPVTALAESLRVALRRTRRERGHTHPGYWAALVVDGL